MALQVVLNFPPVNLIQQVCVKMLQERLATLLVIAPVMPVASWFPMLARWAIHILALPLETLSVHQPHC